MRHIPLGRDSTVLELGCGDGFQLELLRKQFARVFAVDPEDVPQARSGFARCVAEALPFRNQSFDFVISSNVTEHLTDRERAMAEIRRVLRPGGYVAHIVPTRTWKAMSLFFNPIGYPIRVVEKWRARRGRRGGLDGNEIAQFRLVSSPGILQVLRRWLWPPVHGTFSSHLDEYRSYGRSEWSRTFAHKDLSFVAEVPLIFYTPFSLCRFRKVPARLWAASQGLTSTRAYIFQLTPMVHCKTIIAR